MTSQAGMFLLPDRLEPDLDRIRAYWDGLKRGGNEIPFWDDVKFSERSRSAHEVFLVEVFENPLRFRLDLVGDDITRRYGTAVNGKFLDEIEHRAPFHELTAQCWATVERGAPTYYRSKVGETSRGIETGV